MSGERPERMGKPYRQHLKSSKNLETSYEAIRAGFVALALEKNRRATPFVAQARALKAAASRAKTPADLLKIKEIQSGLLTAAGVSDKATNYLEDLDKKEAVKEPIIVMDKGKPVAAVVAIEKEDIETISIGTTSQFLALIERSRARQKAEGGIPSQEMRRRFKIA